MKPEEPDNSFFVPIAQHQPTPTSTQPMPRQVMLAERLLESLDSAGQREIDARWGRKRRIARMPTTVAKSPLFQSTKSSPRCVTA